LKILLDTNIVLDLLMDRVPFSDAAAELFSRVEADATIKRFPAPGRSAFRHSAVTVPPAPPPTPRTTPLSVP